MDTRNKLFVVVGTVAILAAAGATGAFLFLEQDTTTAPASSSPTSSQAVTTTPTATETTDQTTATTASYKDGTYTATTSYSVPHGSNSITTTVTIAGGKITAVSTSNSSNDHESQQYIDSFESGLNSAVVGKSITVSPSRIGGASLTTEAFSETLTDVASQATA